MYNEIYNQSLKWDKEETLYHSFGEDRSSFGFLTYKEAKERKNVLNPLFSKRAIVQLQGLIQNNVETYNPLMAVNSRLTDSLNSLMPFARL